MRLFSSITKCLLGLSVYFTMTSAALALPAPGILGSWKTQTPIYGRGIEFNMNFHFQQNQVTVDVHCLYRDGAQLTVSVSSAATYEANDIYIQETRNSLVEDGLRYCRATLQPTRWQAYFDGMGNMVLIATVPFQTQFKLVPIVPEFLK